MSSFDGKVITLITFVFVTESTEISGSVTVNFYAGAKCAAPLNFGQYNCIVVVTKIVWMHTMSIITDKTKVCSDFLEKCSDNLDQYTL